MAFTVGIPLLWFFVDKEQSFSQMVQSISCIVSLYALGDGLGYMLARKAYGSISVRKVLTLASMAGALAAAMLAYTGGIVGNIRATEDDMETFDQGEILGLLCVMRLLQGLSHGTISLTQQAYIG